LAHQLIEFSSNSKEKTPKIVKRAPIIAIGQGVGKPLGLISILIKPATGSGLSKGKGDSHCK
jgi:hypothetical protein